MPLTGIDRMREKTVRFEEKEEIADFLLISGLIALVFLQEILAVNFFPCIKSTCSHLDADTKEF